MTATPLSYPSTLLPAPFAYAGTKNAIPGPSSSPAASLYDGFPAATEQPLSSGGVPPTREDMNGILNALSQHTAWLNGGGAYCFSSVLAAAFGGYPTNVILQSATIPSIAYISLHANNLLNPDSGPFTITASCATNVLTVTATSQALAAGQVIRGAGIPAGTVISSQLSGTAGGVGTYQLSTTPGTIASEGMTSFGWAALDGCFLDFPGAVPRSQRWKNSDQVSVMDFGAVGDGVTDDTAAFVALFATGRTWFIPWTANGYLVNGCLVITASGRCEGYLKAKAGFVGTSGKLVTINNTNYGSQIDIFGLSVWSTDLRPAVYGAGATVGIYVGPLGSQWGLVDVGGVNLWNCSAARFSVGLQISCFDVSVYSGQYVQNDHGILVYSYDAHLNFNQINNVVLHGVTSSGSTRYSLRLGTSGATFALDATQGVNFVVEAACNFDMPIMLDNMIGLKYEASYHEQAVASGTAIVVGTAGINSVRNITIAGNWFTNYYFAVDVMNQISLMEMRQNTYASITYSALRVYAAETQTSIRYFNGASVGSSPSWSGGTSEVLLNYSAGISLNQLTFIGITISNDYLTNGVQMAPSQTYATSWYPSGQTLDGYRNNASAYGRYRSGAAIQSGIAGTQAGAVFTPTIPAKAALFNGGDRITTSPGGTAFVKSVDPVGGTITLDAAVSATSLSHAPATFQAMNVYGSAAPTTGTWQVADKVWNTAVTATTTPGWICTTAGTPGTWTPMPVL